MNTQMKQMLVIGSIAVGVVIVVVASVLYLKSRTKNSTPNSAVQNTAGSESGAKSNHARVAPAGKKVYYNDKFGFSLLYPENWPLQVNERERGTRTNDDFTYVDFSLYVPDEKHDFGIAVLGFAPRSRLEEPLSVYLSEHYAVPKNVSWKAVHQDFAGGVDAYFLDNFEDLGHIGNLFVPGPYLETPDKRFVVTFGTSQDVPDFLPKSYASSIEAPKEMLSSLRWY